MTPDQIADVLSKTIKAVYSQRVLVWTQDHARLIDKTSGMDVRINSISIPLSSFSTISRNR